MSVKWIIPCIGCGSTTAKMNTFLHKISHIVDYRTYTTGFSKRKTVMETTYQTFPVLANLCEPCFIKSYSLKLKQKNDLFMSQLYIIVVWMILGACVLAILPHLSLLETGITDFLYPTFIPLVLGGTTLVGGVPGTYKHYKSMKHEYENPLSVFVDVGLHESGKTAFVFRNPEYKQFFAAANPGFVSLLNSSIGGIETMEPVEDSEQLQRYLVRAIKHRVETRQGG